MSLVRSGWVYLANSKETRKRFALKHFKDGRVSPMWELPPPSPLHRSTPPCGGLLPGCHAAVPLNTLSMHACGDAPFQEGEGISPTAIREIMLLRELSHDNIVHLDSVHINRAEPSLWLAFDYADHDLFEMIRFHREFRELRRENPSGEGMCAGCGGIAGLQEWGTHARW